MSGTHRSTSSRPAGNGLGRLAITGGIAGVLGMIAIAAVIAILHPDSKSSQAGSPASATTATRGKKAPRTGPSLRVTTPEGYAYSLGAIKSGTDSHPLSDTSPGPPGSTFAYADYVLTNVRSEPALLDFPADLFTRRSKVSSAYGQRCMPQPGAESDMCTLPNHSKIIGYLDDSKPPTKTDGGDAYMPPGASYIIRVATDLPVQSSLKPEDMKLYVWNVRYRPDRKATEVAFPNL